MADIIETAAEGFAEETPAEEPNFNNDKKHLDKGIEKYRYAGNRKFNINFFDTADRGDFDGREDAVPEFVDNLRELNRLQQKLYAERKESVVFIFQAMDAAGKDGVIRTVFSTLTPHGVKEFCFKVPSYEEASHDYLWRFWSALPPRGNISIFNRSYYEDVLVGKVRRLYEHQVRPDRLQGVDIIRQRYSQIKDFEKYLYNTGTRVVKIFLNVSKDEQARRFISRIDAPRKNWKISAGDISEREHWNEYMEAFERMVNTTSTKDSPWYVVPADHKWYARLIVSRIVLWTLRDMDPQYPTIAEEELEAAMALRQSLLDSISDEKAAETGSGAEFTKTGAIAADLMLNEEQGKINGKKQKIRDSGFRAVREMLAKGYILKSAGDIIEAVAEAGSGEKEPEKEAEAGQLSALDRAMDRFGLAPKEKLSRRERQLLEAVTEAGEDGVTDFYSLCDYLDMRPSKVEEQLYRIMSLGFADMDEDGGIFLTAAGQKLVSRTAGDEKSEKKFRRFLEALSGEELEDFVELCNSLETAGPDGGRDGEPAPDGEAERPAPEEPEGPADAQESGQS